MYKTLLAASVVSLALISPVRAADIVEPQIYDWTGPYIGLQGGYAWGDSDASADVSAPVTAPQALDAITVFPSNDGNLNAQGFVGGAHAGYNYQMDSLVLGVEGDIEFADMKDDTDVFLFADDTDPFTSLKKKIDWLGSLRLRAGFAADRALFYATGGLAAGGVELRAEDESDSNTKWGWTLGAGIEYAFTDDLSALIEYRYTELDDSKLDVGDFDRYEADNHFHAVRAGVSWHF